MRFIQCDQIWRNFQSLGQFFEGLFPICGDFGKFCMALGKFLTAKCRERSSHLVTLLSSFKFKKIVPKKVHVKNLDFRCLLRRPTSSSWSSCSGRWSCCGPIAGDARGPPCRRTEWWPACCSGRRTKLEDLIFWSDHFDVKFHFLFWLNWFRKISLTAGLYFFFLNLQIPLKITKVGSKSLHTKNTITIVKDLKIFTKTATFL